MTGVVAFVGHSSLAQLTTQALLERGLGLHTLVVDAYHPSSMATKSASDNSSIWPIRPQSTASPSWYHQPLPDVQGEPVRILGLRDPGTFDILARSRPDYIFSLCFPRRIDVDLLRLARCDVVNLHPSPLPRYRGPAPIFWQLHHGASTIGISVHRMVKQVDAGAVLWQSSIDCEQPVSGRVLAERCAAAGVDGLCQLVEHAPATRVPQDEGRATWYPWPSARDFALDPDWTVAHAARFVIGTQHWSMPYCYGERHSSLQIKQLVSPKSQTVNTNALTLRFKDGTIDVQLHDDDRVSNDGSTA